MSNGNVETTNAIKQILENNQGKLVGKVYMTKDYNKFQRIHGNRSISNSQLKKLERSISRELIPIPVVVNESFDIIDGQHRIRVLEKLEKPIYYIIIKGLDLKYVQMLNTNTANWGIGDFLQAYVELGASDYERFDKFVKNFDFGIANCLNIVYANSINIYYQEKFKDGDFIFGDHESAEAYKYATMIRDIMDSVSDRAYRNMIKSTKSVVALLSLFNHTKYHHGTFIERVLKYHVTFLHSYPNIACYKKAYIEMYNYRSRISRISYQEIMTQEEIKNAA